MMITLHIIITFLQAVQTKIFFVFRDVKFLWTANCGYKINVVLSPGYSNLDAYLVVNGAIILTAIVILHYCCPAPIDTAGSFCFIA